mmetsp:Transcript_51452/g.142389  ORF Transcript_51452/g.142389 Transcript_51452/m.142389 type:complete len:260 (+) Transcript_51452:367-1146(+)
MERSSRSGRSSESPSEYCTRKPVHGSCSTTVPENAPCPSKRRSTDAPTSCSGSTAHGTAAWSSAIRRLSSRVISIARSSSSAGGSTASSSSQPLSAPLSSVRRWSTIRRRATAPRSSQFWSCCSNLVPQPCSSRPSISRICSVHSLTMARRYAEFATSTGCINFGGMPSGENRHADGATALRGSYSCVRSSRSSGRRKGGWVGSAQRAPSGTSAIWRAQAAWMHGSDAPPGRAGACGAATGGSGRQAPDLGVFWTREAR